MVLSNVESWRCCSASSWRRGVDAATFATSLGENPARKDLAAYREDLTRLVDLLAEGRIRPMVVRLPLTEAAEAHRRLEGRQVIGKLVLVPAGVA